LVALMIIFCVLGAAFTFNISVIASDAPLNNDPAPITTTTITHTLVVPENVSICVVRVGIVQADGTVLWTPGYAYPGLPPSQCQNKTEYYTNALGQTVVIHQFPETRIIYTTVVVTMTETLSPTLVFG
jgi:hypothetical protein